MGIKRLILCEEQWSGRVVAIRRQCGCELFNARGQRRGRSPEI